jgi:hypothetical protein
MFHCSCNFATVHATVEGVGDHPRIEERGGHSGTQRGWPQTGLKFDI